MADHPNPRHPADQLAIVGLEVCTENFPDLAAFESAVYSGCLGSGFDFAASIALPDDMCLLSGLNLGSAIRLSPEDILLLTSIAAAIRSFAGASPGRTAVLYTRASELASAVLPRFAPEAVLPAPKNGSQEQFEACVNQMTGLGVNVSMAGNPLSASLSQAQKLLADDAVDLVILAGALLHADIDLVVQKAGIKLNAGPQQFGLDAAVDGWAFGQGAAAISLMRAAQARSEKKRIYALVAGAGFSAKDLTNPRKHIVPTLVSAETIYQSCLQAFEHAAVSPAQIGYLDTFASGFTPLDTAEITGLTKAYRTAGPDCTCALGSTQSLAGYLLSQAGFMALLRTSLCLYNRFIPPAPGWTGPKKPELLMGAPFYVAVEPRTWFQPAADGKRYAALNNIGWDGSCCHLILAEEPEQNVRSNHFLLNPPISLLPFASHSMPDLLEQLAAMQSRIAPDQNLPALARETFASYRQVDAPALVACLVAQNPAELIREVNFSLRDIPAAAQKNIVWQTPAGSYFTPDPVGPAGKISFVYPGAFNSYLGLGRDLFTLFPRLFDFTHNLTSDLGLTVQERRLYPRSLSPLSKEQLRNCENQLNADPIAMITSGSLIAFLYTLILRDIFKVQPDSALGYSLGEIGMLFAMQIWDQADAVSAALKESPLFQAQLSGPKLAVRSHWSLPTYAGDSAPVWENHFLMAPVEKVKAALEHAEAERVYLTHINTPRQVVIGGDPAACARLIAALKCTSLKAPFDFTLHCAAMQSAYTALVDLLSWPVAAHPAAQLFTAAGFAPLTLESTPIAEKISTMLCTPLDFPTLVRRVFSGGARIFIELGANANCTKWIEESLKDENFAAVAVNRKGVEDLASLVKLLARLVSHRVPLDLAPLYP